MKFSSFDIRKYPTASVKEGYAEWAATYEQTVEEQMDIRLLTRLTAVKWGQLRRVVDLACGTGRTGIWLKSKGVREIDGVDITSAMLAHATEKSIYRQLIIGDVTNTPLAAENYDMCIQVLADEHLPGLLPLYAEAARLARPKGYFVIVGYHPHFLMNGIITHFHRNNGEPLGIESYVHQLSDHVKAAHRVGWALVEMDEGIIDAAWLKKKPQWKQYFNHPVSFVMVWRHASTG